jgi:biotin-(acetyl-CoA carboxylase) ligase
MWPRTEYERASVTLGQEVHWDAGTGTAVGIAVDGALVVESDGERIDLHSGEVHTHCGR